MELLRIFSDCRVFAYTRGEGGEKETSALKAHWNSLVLNFYIEKSQNN